MERSKRFVWPLLGLLTFAVLTVSLVFLSNSQAEGPRGVSLCWNIDDQEGWIGVYLKDLTPRLREKLDVDEKYGAVITEVVPDSPAEEAGLEEDDVIVKFDGRKIRRSSDLGRLVRRREPGDKVEMEIIREGERKKIEIEIGERPSRNWYGFDFDLPYRGDIRIRGFVSDAWLGVELQELNKDLAEYFGVKEKAGVLITEVEEDSPAEEAGLKAGDVILKIDDEKVEEPDDVMDIISDLRRGDEVKIQILRKGRKKDFTIKLERPPYKYFDVYPRKFPRRFHFYFDRDRFRDEIEDLEDQLRYELKYKIREELKEAKDIQQRQLERLNDEIKIKEVMVQL